MIRKLSLAVAVATALSPLGVFALGLGEIHTHTALNQHFKADIDLLSVTQEELQDIRVGLASQEAFENAGIDRPFLLTGLKFIPSLTADGRKIIAVSSRDAVREPFLNFLIEVNWPKGRLLREYTVLLDPPVTLARKPAAVQAPRVSTAPAQDYAPVEKATTTLVSEYSPPTSATSEDSRVYGPIKTNDNLWNIAQSLRQEGETVEQVMMALLQYNSDAFIRNNVNRLKAGKILRLPKEADVTVLSPRQARREFIAQTREWREEREQRTARISSIQGSTAEPEIQAELETSDRLELISTKSEESEANQDQEGKAERSNEVNRLERQVLLAKEENASVQLENEALQSRVIELEAQLEDMRRLLSLQSDQMTELQTAQRIVAETTESLESLQPPADQVTELPQVVDVDDVSGEAIIKQVDIERVIAEAIQAEQSTSPVSVTEVESVKQAEAVEKIPTPATGTPAIKSSEPVAKQEPVVQPKATKAPDKVSFLDNLMGNPTLMGLAGAVAVLLLVLLGLIMRRRKEAEAEFAESILVTPDGEAMASASSGAAGTINAPSEETSFMSDFSPSDIDALQDETGEVDPISEADVYIAYGRYQQAEELIKQALERFPDREELKHKLLEIYYSAKNDTKFSNLAEELKQGGLEKEKPDIWAKIVSMGMELNPSNALFAGAIGVAAASGISAEEELDDLGLNLDSSLSDDLISAPSDKLADATSESVDELDSMDMSGLDSLGEMDSENLEVGLSLDSDILDSLDSVSNAEPAMAEEDEDPLNIDLDELGITDKSAGQAVDDSLALASSLDGLSELSELKLDDVNSDSFMEDNDVVGIDNSESLEDLDLESLEKELELLSGDLQENLDDQQEQQEAVAESDVLDLPNELETPSAGLDLDATDEVTTKLDLARAYVDMGDAEGAKSILEEVVTEGSNDQKQQAKELLENIVA